MAISSLLVSLITILCFSSASTLTLKLNIIHTNHSFSYKAEASRKNYLQSQASGDIVTRAISNFPEHPQGFLVNITIGSPPMPQLLHIDTGSELTWVQCHPCSACYKQSLPIFDPSSSKTYGKRYCRNSPPWFTWDAESKTCWYYSKYGDGKESIGTLSTETLTFKIAYSESSLASLSNVVFGCAHANYGSSLGPFIGTGILGLGYGELSLVHRFGSKFSHCLGSLDDPSYPDSVLVIGDDAANIIGDTTPFKIEEDLYFVEMEAISVYQTSLPIDPKVFQRNSPMRLGGTFLDIGSSTTSIHEDAYKLLKREIEKRFTKNVTAADIYPEEEDKLLIDCYKGDIDRDLLEDPTVLFHFSGGAMLSIDVKNLFIKPIPNIFCLAITPSIGIRDMNIIGVNAHINQNIGYDFKAMKVSFESIDCSILFD